MKERRGSGLPRLTHEETLRLHSEILTHMSEGANLTRVKDAVIVYTNPSFDKMFGYAPGELVGQPVSVLNDPADLAPEERSRRIAAEVRTHGRWEGEVPNRGKDGRRIWCHLSISVIDHPKYGQVGICIHRDITQRKLAAAALEEAGRAKDDFLAIVSHELHTPLTGMLGWIWMLRHKSLKSAEAHRALDTIERSLEAQSRIIDDLLDISRISSGKMRLEPCVMDLSAVLREAADVARPAAEARGVRLALPARLPPLWVLGDPKRLQQAFWHLLANAVKFSPKKQSVRVALRRRRGAVVLTVADSGAGIPREFLGQVFDLFSQAERSLTREHGGLGVGLAIVKRVVELHGGSVSVFSRGLGRGARFTVELPAAHQGR